MAPDDADGKGDEIVAPPRRETFLARYPRNLKLAAVVVLFALIFLPGPIKHWFGNPTGTDQAAVKKPESHHTEINSADKLVKNHITKPDAEALPGDNVALNQQDDRSIKLTPAPDSALTEDTAQGSLPRISEDGRQPWQAYARPFNTADKRPRIAIVIMNLGNSRATTDAAIAQLPAEVTLAFSAKSPAVGAWCSRARQDGHEVLLSIPMEPFDYPRSDPGPDTLLTSLPNSDNIERFLGDLRQSTGYIGITTISGSRFTTDPNKMRPILDILKQRGLMIFDAGVAPHSVIIDMAKYDHIPAAVKTVRIDESLAPDAIEKALDELEKEARVNGRAVGVAIPAPLTIEEIRAWSKDLANRGIALAPISAMVQ